MKSHICYKSSITYIFRIYINNNINKFPLLMNGCKTLFNDNISY